MHLIKQKLSVKCYQLIPSALLLIFLVISGQNCLAGEIEYTNRELIRNGDFEEDLHTAWFGRFCNVHFSAVKDGNHGMRMNFFSGRDDRFFFQKLNVPSTLQSATIHFDYRVVEDKYLDPDPIKLQVCIAKSKGFDIEYIEELPLSIIQDIHSATFNAPVDWHEFHAELDQSLISDIQAVHEAGEFVFILFLQTRVNERQGFITHIDNLSLKIDGTQHVPQLKGKIAYLALNENGDPHKINIIDPNNYSINTIWTHPDTVVFSRRSLKWKPDATEIAFVSDHEFLFSNLYEDIFAIKPDGSGIRKITNKPSQNEIINGDYPRVTVTGRILNNSGIKPTLVLGLQGAVEGVHLVSPNPNEEEPFTITNVAILEDPDLFNQKMILYWWNANCHAGIEYYRPIATVTGSTVDLGTITFNAYNCLESFGQLIPGDLSWKNDGSEIGFTLMGLDKVDSSGSTGSGEDLKPSGMLSSNMEWSPIDDRYLYCHYDFSSKDGIYIAEENGEPELLVRFNESISPAWLPDGSGFIFVGNPNATNSSNNIYFYDLNTGNKQLLTYFDHEIIDNLSISPDGRHILFERHNKRLHPYESDFWIMDRLNPVDMWKITDSGNCTSPDWSRKIVDGDGGDGGGDPDGGDGGGGGGGGGGCFISNFN